MNDKILHRYTVRNLGTDSNGDNSPDDAEAEDLGCFGYLRGIRDRAVCLELRKASGNIIAIPYHTIERFEFDPSEGITLHVLGEKIRIKGCNLNTEAGPMVKLFEGITRHRVTWIQETSKGMVVDKSNNEASIVSLQW